MNRELFATGLSVAGTSLFAACGNGLVTTGTTGRRSKAFMNSTGDPPPSASPTALELLLAVLAVLSLTDWIALLATIGIAGVELYRLINCAIRYSAP